jgi:hypothetical protein
MCFVVIGPAWGTITDDEDHVRIADPEDFVRLEVQTALRRPEVTVIPLLVAGARMPDPDDLPTDLRSLSRRNALELSDLRWRYDIQRLAAHQPTPRDHLAGCDGTTRMRTRGFPASVHRRRCSAHHGLPGCAATAPEREVEEREQDDG